MSVHPEWAARRRAIEAGRHWISPKGLRTRWRKAIFNRLLTVFGFFLKLTPLHARGRRNALDLRRVEIEVLLLDLPRSFDGYRILQLSDTHLDVMPELVEAARRHLAGVEVDLLVVTGDVLGRHDAPVVLAAAL